MIALATLASEDTRLGAFGLVVTFFALDSVSMSEADDEEGSVHS